MKRRNHRLSKSLCLAIAGAALLASACVSTDPVQAEFAWEESSAKAASETQLGGQALIHRKRELIRAQKDLAFFYETLTALRQRRDHGGYLMLASFMDAYFGVHLRPMLAPRWQSSHPETMALDVSLRLAEAEMYVQMRDPARAQDTLDEISKRFRGREGMLVELPTGGQGTLGEAMDSILERKWWRG